MYIYTLHLDEFNQIPLNIFYLQYILLKCNLNFSSKVKKFKMYK